MMVRFDVLRCRRIRTLPAILLSLVAVFFSGHAHADEADPSNTKTAQILELNTRLQQLQSELAAAGDDEKPDANTTRKFEEAIAQLKAVASSKADTNSNEDLTQALADEAEKLSQPPEVEELDPTELSDAELAAALAKENARLAAVQVQLRSEQTKADTPPAQRSEALRATQQELEKKLKTETEPKSEADQNSLSGRLATFSDDVRKFTVNSNLASIASQIFAINAEAALKLPTLRLNATKALAAQLSQRVDLLQEEITKRAQSESRSYSSDANGVQEVLTSLPQSDTVPSFSAHVEYAGENRLLVSQSIPQETATLKAQRDLLQRLTAQDAAMRAGVRRFGAGGEIGRALRQFSKQFPDPSVILQQIETQEQATTSNYIEHSNLTADISILESYKNRLSLTDQQQAALTTHEELLTALKDNQTRHSTVLAELQTVNYEILSLLEEWKEFSNEHLLWLPSHSPLGRSTSTEAASDFRVVANNVASAFVGVFSEGMISTWATVLPLLLLCGAFLGLQGRFRQQLHELSVVADRKSCSQMTPTLRALVLTFITAAEWPLIILLIGVVFRADGRTGAAAAFGHALTAFGMLMAWMNTVRQCLRAEGLLLTHFRWQETLCRILRRWFHTVIAVTSVLLLFFLIVHFCQTGSESAALERVIFVIVMVLIGMLLWQLLVPWSKPFVKIISQRYPVAARTRWFWAAVPVGFPFLLAGLSAAGFHHTALQLNDRISWTIIAASIVILFHQLMMRWLKVASTRTRLQLARERAAMRSAESRGVVAEKPSTPSSIPSDVAVTAAEDDFEFLGLQAHSLVRNAAILTLIGCVWAIWADVLPALRVVERYELWSVSEDVTVVDDEGKETIEVSSRPITVGDLIFAVFALVLTTVGVRQLPGVIAIVMQSRGFENGIRYAVSTVSRYALLIIGTITVCHTVGLRWSQVQWLAAGLSVGLGFGLQEVFANFVSGIIILVERPIRIGDIVTLDGVSGVVSRIRIRATSITDWDRREYIVPNREFVTGKLLNWTLSDTTNRVVVNVGIGYGCDSDEARRIMLEVADSHPNIMKDPGPIATFEGFGDSALNLILRAYLPDLDNRLGTITELHAEIHRRFADAGIDIPYPQRDVNFVAKPAAFTEENNRSPTSENDADGAF